MHNDTDSPHDGYNEIRISVVMPCLNEAEALGRCIDHALAFLLSQELPGEVIIVDNGSTDESARIALSRGAVLVEEPRRGYGNACLKGLSVARGEYVILLDADGTYDIRDAASFLEHLEYGCDLVVGSRLSGRISTGAMPFLHRFVGVPTLTWIMRLVSGSTVSDAHCGLRGARLEAIKGLRLKSSGMEFASEMLVQAAMNGLRIKELPVSYHSRVGRSKLRTFRDGWRHLSFLLIFAIRNGHGLQNTASEVVADTCR